MANNYSFIIHIAEYKKGSRHDYDTYKKNQSVIPKEIVNVFDLRQLGVEKDFPEQKSSLPYK